jgi:hypothetical protein
VYRLASLLLAASLGACVTASTRKSEPDKHTQQILIERARKIVTGRGWPLPPGYRVIVDTFEFIPEMAPSFEEYVVIFDLPRPHKSAAPLYRVSFLTKTGKFTAAYDERENIRDEEVDVACRAFERRFPGVHYTTISGPEERVVKVTFLFDKAPYRPGHLTPQRTVDVIVDRATVTVKSLRERHE